MNITDKDLAILRTLKIKERLARKEIIRATDIHPSMVASRLELLVAAGYARKPTWGIYEITEKGKEIVWKRKREK